MKPMEQPPKPKTQKEIDSAKKKMEDTFSPELKQKIVDLKIGGKTKEEEESENDTNKTLLDSIERGLSKMGRDMSNMEVMKGYSEEERQELFEDYDELKKKRDEFKKAQEEMFGGEEKKTDDKDEGSVLWPKGRVNLDGEKIKITEQENKDKDPDVLPHTAQWTGGVDVPQSKKEETPEFYNEFLNEEDNKSVHNLSMLHKMMKDGERGNSEEVSSEKKEEQSDFVDHLINKAEERTDFVGEQNRGPSRVEQNTSGEQPVNREGAQNIVQEVEPPVILHEEPSVGEVPEQQTQETQPPVAAVAQEIRNVAPAIQRVERGEKKEYTPDQARKALDILCGNADFSLVTYNASSEDRELLSGILKKDWNLISPADKEKILPVIERTFTQRVVDKALELHGIRDAREAVRQDVLAHAKEKGLSYEDSLKVMKSKLREGNRSYATLEQSNRFEPTLIELKKLMLKDKAAALEEEFRGHGYSSEKIDALLVEKLVTGEKQRIFDEKKGEYVYAEGSNSYEQLLLKMVFREQQVDQRKVEEIYEAESMKHPGVFRKTMNQLAKIPRPWRSAIIGATIAGGGLTFGLGAGTAAAMSVPLYLGYRAVRSITGGTFGYYLQKWAGEKIVDAAYTSDIRKAYKDTVETGGDIMSQSDQLKQMVLERDFDSFAEKNYEYGKILDEQFRKKEAVANKYRTWNRRFMTLVTGVVGGNLGAQLIDAGADAAMGAIGGIGAVEQATGGARGGTHIPESPSIKGTEFATAGKGDSVWTLIEENSEKNIKGFGDLNEAQRTYFVDHLKDQVTSNPGKFGLENADQIKIGYGKELQSLFENNQDIQNALESARHLTKEQMESILQSNASQRAALFESARHIKPTLVPDEVVPPTPEDIVEHSETIPVAGVDAYGVETTKEIPADLMQNKELAQAYLNYKGNPNFIEGSQSQEWAQGSGAEHLVKLSEQHPEYLKIDAVREALREIHTNNLVDELHEGGAFKFLNSADSEDLLRETTGLARTYGLDTYRAQSFSDFIAQGNEMNEQTFTQFTDPDTGSFIPSNFEDAIKHFHELEVITTPPEIPDGQLSSAWEPRLLSVNGADPIVGLVRQSAPDIFEYRTPTGLVDSGVSKDVIEKFIVKPPSAQ
ncbi:hypothetical protein C4565_02200 [Candidatus Parcubacteria bacterium]|jgi:hypothetical protein|nr:MAG: hypothetical protein C4565_02200 [Candidatus Parcubacteria bacterium]